MYAKENYKYTIEYGENSFYNKLTEEEQERYLKHIMALKYKIWIHQFDHLLKKTTGRKKVLETKRPGRPGSKI